MLSMFLRQLGPNVDTSRMSVNRFVTYQFCDDVRQEIGNKFSLMGCYGTKMFVTSFPATLPRLCLQAKVYSPIEHPIHNKIVVRLMRDDQAIAELSADLSEAPGTENPNWARWQVLNFVLIASPFPLEGPCKLRVEAESGDERVESGYFAIEGSPPSMEVAREIRQPL